MPEGRNKIIYNHDCFSVAGRLPNDVNNDTSGSFTELKMIYVTNEKKNRAYY